MFQDFFLRKAAACWWLRQGSCLPAAGFAVIREYRRRRSFRTYLRVRSARGNIQGPYLLLRQSCRRFSEGFCQRRADKWQQLAVGAGAFAAFFQGILYAADDAGCRVGKGAVKVEKGYIYTLPAPLSVL